LAQLLLQVQSLVVFQELSSLEEDLVNTQQWAEDKKTSLFSYFIISF
jgi:hypothetical protein